MTKIDKIICKIGDAAEETFKFIASLACFLGACLLVALLAFAAFSLCLLLLIGIFYLVTLPWRIIFCT